MSILSDLEERARETLRNVVRNTGGDETSDLAKTWKFLHDLVMEVQRQLPPGPPGGATKYLGIDSCLVLPDVGLNVFGHVVPVDRTRSQPTSYLFALAAGVNEAVGGWVRFKTGELEKRNSELMHALNEAVHELEVIRTRTTEADRAHVDARTEQFKTANRLTEVMAERDRLREELAAVKLAVAKAIGK